MYRTRIESHTPQETISSYSEGITFTYVSDSGWPKPYGMVITFKQGSTRGFQLFANNAGLILSRTDNTYNAWNSWCNMNGSEPAYLTANPTYLTTTNLYGALYGNIYVPTGWFKLKPGTYNVGTELFYLPDNKVASINTLIMATNMSNPNDFVLLWIDISTNKINLRGYPKTITTATDYQFLAAPIFVK